MVLALGASSTFAAGYSVIEQHLLAYTFFVFLGFLKSTTSICSNSSFICGYGN